MKNWPPKVKDDPNAVNEEIILQRRIANALEEIIFLFKSYRENRKKESDMRTDPEGNTDCE